VHIHACTHLARTHPACTHTQHAHTHTPHTHTHTQTHTPPTNTHTHAHTHMHKHTHTCTHKHAHARTHARTHTHSHTHAHTHTHTHTHAHTHTHTLSISQSHSPDRRITHTLPRVFDPQECVWGVCFMWSCICAREKRFLVPQRTCTARTPKLSIPAPSTRPRSCFRRRGACTQHRMFVCVQRPG